jgi:hypothetical protein
LLKGKEGTDSEQNHPEESEKGEDEVSGLVVSWRLVWRAPSWRVTRMGNGGMNKSETKRKTRSDGIMILN